MNTKILTLFALAIMALTSVTAWGTTYQALETLRIVTTPNTTDIGCVAFSPLVQGYDHGNFPPTSVILSLLDNLRTNTKYRCIQVFALNSYIAGLAQSKGFKVVGVAWLYGYDRWSNNININDAIAAARDYPNTVVSITCGSEMGYRYGTYSAIEQEILNCVNLIRNSGLTTPIGVNDTPNIWNTKWWTIANAIDFIGVNIYPWYDNPWSCTTHSAAAYQTLVRYQYTKSLYPNKMMILSEYGWPKGGWNNGCATVGVDQQRMVLQGVVDYFRQYKYPAIAFAGYSEPWKANGNTYATESQWGNCYATYPYQCTGYIH